MNEQIFIVNNQGQLVEMNESTYISEDLLQKLLADYPALISGSQINPEKPRRWLLISREIGVPDEKDANQRWSLDHLFIDQDGIPTLIEVKRSSDTRIRREVIGQILDYASNAVAYWSINDIIRNFEETCKKSGIEDSNSILNEFLREEIELNSFWDMTATNLKAGKIRLLIVADTIPKELQRIIEFLNEQMNPAEILGVEIKQFIGQDLKTLVPRVIGKTFNAQAIKNSLKSKEEHWNEETFFAELLIQQGIDNTEIAKEILTWIKTKVNSIWYGVGQIGSMVPYNKDVDKNRDSYRYCFALWTNGNIEIYFQHMKNRPPFDTEQNRLELLERLNKIRGISIPKEKVNGRPSFSISVLKDKVEFDKFKEAFNWFWNEHN